MSTARTGYDALEALTDGSITGEERGWLSERAAESPEWAAAVQAHTPPDEAASEKMVAAILQVIDEDKVVELSAHPTMRRSLRPLIRPFAAAVAIAAGVAMFTIPTAKTGAPLTASLALPSYAATREGAAMCSDGQVRGPEVSNADCNLFVIRPATSYAGTVEVRAFDAGTKQAIAIARVEATGLGVLHVLVEAAHVSGTIEFVIGAPGKMPASYEAAMSAGDAVTRATFSEE